MSENINEKINTKVKNSIYEEYLDMTKKSVEQEKARSNRRIIGGVIFCILLGIELYFGKQDSKFLLMISIPMFSIITLLNSAGDTRQRNETRIIVLACLLAFFSYQFYSKLQDRESDRKKVAKLCYERLDTSYICQEIDDILTYK